MSSIVMLALSVVIQTTEDARPPSANTQDVQLAVEKGLFFVERSAIQWWQDKKCVSCHDGPALMFSHNIAKRQGFPIDQQKLDFWMDRWIIVGGLTNKRKDGRHDAGGMLGAPLTLLFRDLAADNRQQRADNLVKLMQIAGKDWQQASGSWDIKVGLDYVPWITMALASFEKSNMPLSEPVRRELVERREHTEAWLATTARAVPEKTEDLAAWIVYEYQRGDKKRLNSLLKELFDRQRDDGTWGPLADSEKGHLLVTGAALFALTSAGLSTDHPQVAKTQRTLLDRQLPDGRWQEGGRIFDDGSDTKNVVFNTWATGVICAALSQTIHLPAGAKRVFNPDPQAIAELNKIAAKAAEGYVGEVPADEDPTD